MLNIDKDILTPHEVAVYLRITQQTVIKMLKRKDLKGIKITRRGDWKIRKQDLFAYIEENTYE